MRLGTWIGVVVAVAGTGCSPVIACAEPHDNEVDATFDVGGTDVPGDQAVREVVCFLHAIDLEKLEGSAQDSGSSQPRPGFPPPPACGRLVR